MKVRSVGISGNFVDEIGFLISNSINSFSQFYNNLVTNLAKPCSFLTCVTICLLILFTLSSVHSVNSTAQIPSLDLLIRRRPYSLATGIQGKIYREGGWRCYMRSYKQCIEWDIEHFSFDLMFRSFPCIPLQFGAWELAAATRIILHSGSIVTQRGVHTDRDALTVCSLACLTHTYIIQV